MKFKTILLGVLSISLITSTMISHVSANEADIDKNLIAHYDFNKNSMNKINPGTYDGELEGDISLKVDMGIEGGAAYFPKSEGSLIRIRDVLNTSTTSYTLSAWIKYDKDAFNGKDNINIFQQSDSGRTLLFLKDGSYYASYITGKDLNFLKNVTLDMWHNVTLVSQPQDKTIQLYINGEYVNTMSTENTSGYPNDMTDLILGAHKNPTANTAMKGYIDEVRIYDSVISDTVIKDIYNQYKLVTTPIEININTNEVIRDIEDHMFGINHRYHENGYGSFKGDGDSGTLYPQFNDYVKEAAFGSIRYPGGTVSNLFDWKHAIGKDGERIDTIHGNIKEPIDPNFGVDEAMSWIYDELDAKAIWVYGMGIGSASDAADLFEYLNAPADGDKTNINGGIDWAEVRKNNGHEQPYCVDEWEIGNEFGYWGQDYWMIGDESRGSIDKYTTGGIMSFQNYRVGMQSDWRDSAALSNGNKNQVKVLKYATNTGAYDVNVYVNGVKWDIVDTLDNQGQNNVCSVNYDNGEIIFGDGIHGNIPTTNSIITATYKTKQDGFIDYYIALKAAAKQLGMEIGVYSCMEKHGNVEFTDFIGKTYKNGQYNDYYDGIVIHPYSDNHVGGNGNINSPSFFKDVLVRSQSYNMTRVQTLVNNLSKYPNSEGKIRVPVLSEFGIFRLNGDIVRGLGHGIYIANEMIDYINFNTPYINKHCLVDYPYGADNLGTGDQAVIQSIKQNDGTYQFVSTPSAKTFAIFNTMTGNKQVGHDIKGNSILYTDGTYHVNTIKVLTSCDDGNTYITIVNNKEGETTDIQLSIDNKNLKGSTIDIKYLTGESVRSENTLINPNHVSVKTDKLKINQDTKEITYTLTPNSITAFKISTVNKDALNAKIEEVKDVKADAYTKESYDAFKAALDTAKTVLADEQASQDAVDTALSVLEDAYKALVKKPALKPFPFTDVSNKQWYYGVINEAYQLGLMTGASDSLFKPNANMNRGMVAIVFHRMEGSKKVEYSSIFPDVANKQYYTTSVLWAKQTGVINGYTNGTFKPLRNVSREEMATMIYNFARYKGLDMSASKDITYFSDYSQITPYARVTLQWAVEKELMSGKLNGTKLDPLGTATRAECSKMLVQAYKVIYK